ncbi:class I SAM-dependent methyltransferase [Saccharomonospora sp. NPDC046836]|uniref:class I SAM-dependent methyltransferase n=1 Tax=Saccharomonospora sp. NPDC046836 TaxID=3156921 RepID=UPI0033DF602A
MTEPAYLADTRVAYDIVAANYAELLETELAGKPLDRAMLATFAELTAADDGGPVADIGCGPGRVTAHLRSLGVTAFGIDLSPGMIEEARRRYPGLRFEVGSMTGLDLSDGELAGIVAWYSIIHTPPESLPVVFAEFHRTLAPGAHLLLAFQAGNERRRIEQGYGHRVSLDAYRLAPDRIAEQLCQAGIVVTARLLREPTEQEKTPQAYLLAHKPRTVS